MLADPQADCREIIFAVRPHSDGHWYENFGGSDSKRINWHDGTRLCRLNLQSGRVTAILDDAKGGIRDPHLSYDASTILFSYRKAGTEHYRLHEIKVDGTGLKQLTPDDGPHDDIEPIYTPGGDIVFGSSRVHRQVPCWTTEAAILHRCKADGSGIHPISANVEHENTPCMLPDGRILFMRWEYVDRHEGAYHHLWTMNPDGTNVTIHFGNSWAGGVYLDAQPVPRTQDVLFVDSPGHGVSDHYGFLSVLDGSGDPDNRKRASRVGERKGIRNAPKDVKGNGLWGRDPYPLSAKWFLFADGVGIHLANFEGDSELIYKLPADQAVALQPGGTLKGKELPKELPLECHEPRPLRPRPRETIIPDRVDLTKATGCMVLADVLNGRNMKGVKPGEIRKIQVFEILPKPCDSNDVNLERPDRTYRFLKRVLGEFPVEQDGSANVELPAMRALQFVALDERSRSVKHMLSFVSVMPGEVVSCIGCHELRTQTPRSGPQGLAQRRPPSRLEAVPGVPEIIDFPRDIQPVLDRHCVSCHNADSQAGRADLSGDRGTWRSFGFINLVRNGRASLNMASTGNLAPHSYGSGASPILRFFETGHEKVNLSEPEIRLIQTWLDIGVTYQGAYVAAPHQASAGKADEVLANRCAQCHKKDRKDPEKVQFWLARFGDEKLGIQPRALIFNLTRPEKSLALRAPLAKDAGGLGWCKTTDNAPVFSGANDVDYQALLAGLTKGHEELLKAQGLVLGRNAAEKLKLYGLLPATFNPQRDPVASVFDLERKYYEMTYPKFPSAR
jgi:mono/diheme cytochrome c family protein